MYDSWFFRIQNEEGNNFKMNCLFCFVLFRFFFFLNFPISTFFPSLYDVFFLNSKLFIHSQTKELNERIRFFSLFLFHNQNRNLILFFISFHLNSMNLLPSDNINNIFIIYIRTRKKKKLQSRQLVLFCFVLMIFCFVFHIYFSHDDIAIYGGKEICFFEF